MQNGLIHYGGAVTVDGVHLKVQGEHYYDFTKYFMQIYEQGPFSDAQFEIRNVNLMLVEGPDHPTAKNI